MTRKITLAAVATVAFVVLGACSKGDDYADSAAGATTGAMATPPASYPVGGTTSTIGSTTGTMSTLPDSADSAKWSNADSLRHKTPKKTP
jgi:hypothetical protein